MAKHDQKQTLWDNFNDFIFINSIFGSKWNGVNRESCVCIMLMLIIIWWDYCIWYTIQYHAVQCNWMATQQHWLSGKKIHDHLSETGKRERDKFCLCWYILRSQYFLVENLSSEQMDFYYIQAAHFQSDTFFFLLHSRTKNSMWHRI